MEAQNNNQHTVDNDNNLYKISGQEDQVECLTSILLDGVKVLIIMKKLNVTCSKTSACPYLHISIYITLLLLAVSFPL